MSNFILPQPLLCKLQKYDVYENVSPEGKNFKSKEKMKEYGKGKWRESLDTTNQRMYNKWMMALTAKFVPLVLHPWAAHWTSQPFII